jgi:hypothetical protein
MNRLKGRVRAVGPSPIPSVQLVLSMTLLTQIVTASWGDSCHSLTEGLFGVGDMITADSIADYRCTPFYLKTTYLERMQTQLSYQKFRSD